MPCAGRPASTQIGARMARAADLHAPRDAARLDVLWPGCTSGTPRPYATPLRFSPGGKTAAMQTVATIGVYGWSLEQFLDALRDADVGLVADVRQRRGVRGREYSWANAQRLQTELAAAGIGYSHHKELAPTTELRHVQYREDERLGVGKRSRVELAPEYRERYLHEILDRVDLSALIAELPAKGA